MKKSKIVFFVCVFVVVSVISVFCCDKWDIIRINNKPLVSIVITSYNRTQLLKRAIDSACHQTYKNIEIVIVDDGSNEETLNVLKNYENKDARINLVSLPKNSGTAAFPRAVGNSIAKGKYIVILDSDDVLMPEMVEKSVDYLESNQHVTLLRVETRHYRSDKDPYKNQVKFEYPLYYLLVNSIGQGGVVFRRDFVVKHNIYPDPDMSCGEDWDFFSKLLMNKANFATLSGEPLYIIRHHTENSYSDCDENHANVAMKITQTLTNGKQELSKCELLKKAIEFNPNIFNEETQKAGLKNFCK